MEKFTYHNTKLPVYIKTDHISVVTPDTMAGGCVLLLMNKVTIHVAQAVEQVLEAMK